LADGLANATCYVLDDIIPWAVNAADGIRQGVSAAGKATLAGITEKSLQERIGDVRNVAGNAKHRVATVGMMALDSVVERTSQEQFNRVMDVIAPAFGLALVSAEKVQSWVSRNNRTEN